MSHRILLPLAVLVGIIIGAVAFRPLPMVNAQTKPPAAQPPVANPPVIADPTLKPVPNDPTVKPVPAEVAKSGAKWEYKTIRSLDDTELNAAAAEGYELVSTTAVAGANKFHFFAIFKRSAK